MTSESTRKESNKKASSKYYKKNKDLENQKARKRMRQLRSKRAAEKCTEQAPSGNGSTSTGELPKEQPSPESPAGDSDRSLTPDHLRGPTPEYLRDYVWEAQMEQLRLNNEKLRMKQEEIEVETMLLVLSDSDDDDPSDSDELECVPDSEGYLLLAPDSDGA